MTLRLNPYISFRDNAREAMEFYQTVFGGELTLSTFGEMHASEDPAEADKIMHAHAGDRQRARADGRRHPEQHGATTPGNNIAVSSHGDDDDELRGYWEKLSDGGTVDGAAREGSCGATSFGMCVDRFGITWLVNIAGTPG